MEDLCPYCQSKTLKVTSGSIFTKCANCLVSYRIPRPTFVELQQLYEESWLDPSVHVGETGATSSHISALYLAKLDEILAERGHRPLPTSRILDFGAGSGALSEALVYLGADVQAVEPFGHEALNAKGVRSVRSLSDLAPDKKFDGIVSLDVVEHLLEPWNDLALLRERLLPDGWIFISTPNLAGMNARVTGRHWRELHRLGHVTMFSPAGLSRMMQDVGFENVRQLHWDIDYGAGGVRSLLHHALQALHLDGELRVFATRQ